MLSYDKNILIERIVIFTTLFLVLSAVIIQYMPDYKLTIIFYMSIVYFSAAFSTLAQHIVARKRNASYSALLASLCILFSIFIFRNGNAVDDINYQTVFFQTIKRGASETFLVSSTEPGYLLILACISRFTQDYFWVQFITGVIPLLIIYKAIVLFENKIHWGVFVLFLSTCFFFQMVSINLSRMFIALAISLVALFYIMENKEKKGVAYIALATLFHYSALVMILTVIVVRMGRKKRFSQAKLMAFVIITPVVLVVATKLGSSIVLRYSDYTTSTNFSVSEIINSMTRIPLLLIIVYFKQFISDFEKKERVRILQYVYTMGVIIKLCSIFSVPQRLVYYFDFVSFICSAELYMNIKNENKRKLLLILFTLLGGFFLLRTQFLNPQQSSILFPYIGRFLKV